MNEETLNYVITSDEQDQRLDKALSALCEEHSRARLQSLIKEGAVCVNGRVLKQPSVRMDAGDVIELLVPEPVEASPQPEKIPLDILFEDEHMLVLNKAAGLVVHPGAGNWTGTLVNALLYHCGDSLSGIGGVIRPGIVHRLDKETAGLMVVAKTDQAHQYLSDQLRDRTLRRIYHALCIKVPQPVLGVVDRPIGRDARNRLKMTITGRNSRDAVTHYRVVQNFSDALSLVECRLETGRTHQIRVHMDGIGHALIGDPLYGPQPTAVRAAMNKAGFSEEARDATLNFPHQVLYAREISFLHPVSEEKMTYQVDAPPSIQALFDRF